jgi:hypothetical protein
VAESAFFAVAALAAVPALSAVSACLTLSGIEAVVTVGVPPTASSRSRTPWASFAPVTASSASLPVRTASAWICPGPTLFLGRVVAA